MAISINFSPTGRHLILLHLLLLQLYYVAPYGNEHQQAEDSPKVIEDKTWSGLPHLGQASAVSVDGDGNLHVFHRADRVWDDETFDSNYVISRLEDGPIANDTVLVIDPSTGKVLYSWGANRFYMPHGLTVDDKGNTWVTDVGLHQVFKFPARESTPTLALGEALVPGNGKHHFCQPTDVAVTKNGYFFVSDGYCNSRVLMFSPRGFFIKEIGAEDGMRIPHSLTVVPEHGAICVADRERWRILCYSSGLDGNMPGIPLAKVEGQGLGRVYGIARRGDKLFAVNGADFHYKLIATPGALRGVVIDIGSGKPGTLWGPDQGFSNPHDVTVSPDGKFAYVSEIDLTSPKRVYKFKIKD